MQEFNEDVLVAALAVLTGAVGREDLQAAMAALSGRSDSRLEEVFRERGLLDGPRIGVLRMLAAGHLERHHGDILATLRGWNAEDSSHDILTEYEAASPRSLVVQMLGEALGSTIRLPDEGGEVDPWATAALPPGGAVPPEGAAPAGGGTPPGGATPPGGLAPPGDATSPPGGVGAGAGPGNRRERPQYTQERRFERIKLHAKGGIGRVWKARDLELQRDVALKEIKPELAGRADQNDRFLLEAEITGNLEHPGIVPVYSLGSDAQGRPFYAMRFIRGESLSEAIRRFHRLRKEATAGRDRKRSVWGVEFQQLLRRFLEVCDAMEYAHSRGVLHRDLKPSNIMLGEYGETLIVDWGLAKVLGLPEAASEDVPPVEPGKEPEPDAEPGAEVGDAAGRSISPSALARAGIGSSSGDRTVQGTKLGTPSYMSPEQARGEIDRLGKASDVYSLGATLYELVCGRGPLAELKDAPEILVRVANGDVPPPRVVLATVPAPLEAICQKAMAFHPEDRYASARELALDLEHWIADEPVSAFPEGRARRLARWLRQHRTWTYAAAASLLAIALVATAATIRLDAARRGEQEARKDAEAGFEAAVNAVNQYLTNVSENELLKKYDTLDISELRKQLLGSALPFYKSFVEKRGHDPRLRLQLAEAYIRLGLITRNVGSTTESLGYYRSALENWRALAAAAPEDLSRRLRVADCLFAIGEVSDASRSAEALASLDEAMAIYAQAAKERPDEPRLREQLATCLCTIGFHQSLVSRSEEALPALRRAREILEELVRDDPKNLDYEMAMARVLNRMGCVEYTCGRFEKAMELHEEFQKACRKIFDSVTQGPKPLEFEDMLATSYEDIGAIRLKRSLSLSALEAYREAEKHRTRLVELAGSVGRYKIGLARTYLLIAHVEHELGRDTEALDHAGRARRALDQLLAEAPDELAYLRQFAEVATIQGVIHDAARRNDLALGPFEEALRVQQKLEPRLKDDAFLKDWICWSFSNLGETYADMGKPGEARPYYREAMDRRIALTSAHPEFPTHAADMARQAILVGDFLRQIADPAAAAETFARTLETMDRVRAGRPADGADAALRVQLLDRGARALAEQGKIGEAADNLARAAAFARAALRAEGPETPAAASLRGALSETLRDLAELPIPARPAAERDRLRSERDALWRGRTADEARNLAKVEAVAANGIGYGKTPLPPAGEESRRADREMAVSHLRIAIQKGLRDADRLRDDADLGPLLPLALSSDEGWPSIPVSPFSQ